MKKSIERQIDEIYNQVYKKVFDTSAITKLTNNNTHGVYNNVVTLKNSKKYNEFCKKFAKELAKRGLAQQSGIWRKYYKAAKKSHTVALPMTYHEYELDVLSKAVKHNFDMIKSIPDKVLEIMNHKYASTLIEEVAKGTITRGSFKRQLASHGHKNAKLIARTETAKLQTAILEQRATILGSEAYIWLSSNDKRTRPSHKAMNGVVVFWRKQDEKPLLDGMRGNAGEFPNCRCNPQPIVDLDDLTKSNYKVYNYKTDKIIILNNKKLKEIIVNKGIF